MGKRYIVTEDNGCGGCGCGAILGIALIYSIFSAMLPYLIPVGIVGLAVFLFFYIPKYKENKKKKNEEMEIYDMERANELERRRIQAEKDRDELNQSKSQYSDDDWNNF